MATHALHLPRNLRRPLALAIAVACASVAASAWAQTASGALPRVGNVASGNVNLSVNPDRTTPIAVDESMTITQTSKGAVINWGSFDVGAGNTLNFVYQLAGGGGGVTLNRVVGLDGAQTITTSNIDGVMNATGGTVFLINPAGAIFGNGSTINVGGLVASTTDISDSNFYAGVGNGHYVFDGTTGDGDIANGGSITAASGGLVALFGNQVDNSGSISAAQGTVALAAGSTFTLDVGGDGLTQLTITAGATNPNGVSVTNEPAGRLTADGGQVTVQAASTQPVSTVSFASVVNDGVVQAHSLQSRDGRILLSSSSDNGNDSVAVNGGTLDASGTDAGVGGGDISLDGSEIYVNERPVGCEAFPCVYPVSVLDASGTTGGGTIDLNARDLAGIDSTSTLRADATGNGNGGSITVNGANGLYGYGSYSAKGGAAGGNGGSILTSGGALDLDGIKVDASAPAGTAGVWTIRAGGDVTIDDGAETGTFPDGLVPPAATTIQDSDIGNALNNSTSVTVQTAANPYQVGDVTFEGADIERTLGTAPTTFRIDANGSINNDTEDGGDSVASTNGAGAVGIAFDANANGAYNGDAYNGNIDLYGMSLYTNGGDVMFYGQGDPVNGYASSSQLGIHFDAGAIDTRVGQNDGGAGGSVTMRGVANDSVLAETGIDIAGSSIATSTSDITLRGSVATGDDAGVGLSGITVSDVGTLSTSLSTTSGNITIDGTSLLANDQADKWGVRTSDTSITTQSGTIAIMGRAEGTRGSAFVNRGVQIGDNTSIHNGTGRTLIAGEATSGAAGVEISDTASIDGGSGTVVVQARNNGAGDALVVAGLLASTGTIDLRPGGVDADGNVTEEPNDAINLGGTLGFALDSAEMGYISTAHLVLGSDIQTGAITVSAPINYDGNLTLDAGSGGGIAINGALNAGANTLALVSMGGITQAAPITAGSLLAQSSGGSVILGNAGNHVSSATLAGSAAGDFTFVNAGDLGIGTVVATSIAAATDTPAALSDSGIGAGGNLLAQSLAGNLLLNGNVSGTTVNLIADGPTGLFLDNGNASIGASGYWHVWASTWTGENRGGLAGSGSLPNLYGCTYGGSCAAVPATDANQFIYVAQPVATIDIAGQSREYGLPNGALTYAVSGMVLGDEAANVITGTVSTDATQASNVGNYAVDGSFISPAGYLIETDPGVLAITPATLTYTADPYSRVYGDPNGTLAGNVTGFRNGDTLGSATTGTLAFSTDATQASAVSSYAIDGAGLAATNYVFVQAAGNASALAITPATLTYVADPYSRVYGDPNGALAGNVTGFRNGDTLASATTGALAFTTDATQASAVGSYTIDGGGLAAANYVFVQAAGNTSALAITPATLTYTADPYSRVYGDPNGTLAGNVTGFRNGDTLASATTGTLAFSTDATQASAVGSYAIDGGGLAAANYVFVQAAGNASALAITPATLTYVADPLQRLVGTPNGALQGSVTGFRNGDTLASATTGTLSFQSPAGTNSPVGIYGIFGNGLGAANYVFVQANGNETALAIDPPQATYTLDVVRDTPVSYVYDRNFGMVGLCPATDLAAGSREQDGDTLAREWSRVRSRPNLANCISTKQKNSCGDF